MIATATRTYTYSHLGPKAQEKAREWFRQYDHDVNLDILETDLSDHFGITDCKLCYSLGYCQGDGVAFEGQPDLNAWRKADAEIDRLMILIEAYCLLFGIEPPEYHCKIEHHGHYYHQNSMDVDVPHDWTEDGDSEMQTIIEGFLAELQEHCREAVKEISRQLEETGYDEIEYQQSDEYIGELLENNEYKFTRKGTHIQ